MYSMAFLCQQKVDLASSTPATLFSLNPFLVYFRKGYTVILIDNIQQPDIFFELLWYFHFQ